MLLLVVFSLSLLVFLAHLTWKGKVAPPAVVCGCGRPDCNYHTLTQEEIHHEMWRVARLLEANERKGRIIQDRIDTEPRNEELRPMLSENIREFIELMKAKDCLCSLCRNPIA